MILGFKHADKTHAVLSFMPWLKTAGQDFLMDADYLVPVPLHPWRLLRRRYNQAGLMAQRLGVETGIPVLLDALKRNRHTPSQGHLKAGERSKNVLRAFSLNEKYSGSIKKKKIVLIDDVFTTGSTIKECSKILLKGGASDIFILTLARVIKE